MYAPTMQILNRHYSLDAEEGARKLEREESGVKIIIIIITTCNPHQSNTPKLLTGGQRRVTYSF